MDDVLFIGVRCINACNYTLLTDYFETTTITDANRLQIRLDGDSSNLFEYFIPSDSTDGFTRAITFQIISEDDYSPIDLYFSLDDTINIIEEKKIQNVLQNGVGTYFTDGDQGWCSRCFVYFYVEVKNPGRYYITINALSRNYVIK